jgi:hypothetical protein
MKASDSLRQSADLFEERGNVYGDAYKNFGHVMKALFPHSVGVHTVEGFNRLGVLTQIVMKIVRYANQFEAGGHDDSLLDLSTYAAMLRGLDAEGRSKGVAFPGALSRDELDAIQEAIRSGESKIEPFQDPSRPFPRGSDWKAEVEIEPVVLRRQTDFENDSIAAARREMIYE